MKHARLWILLLGCIIQIVLSSPVYGTRPVRGEMPDYLDGRAQKAVRTERDTSVISSDGHFRVHYDVSCMHSPDMTDAD